MLFIIAVKCNLTTSIKEMRVRLALELAFPSMEDVHFKNHRERLIHYKNKGRGRLVLE